MAMKISLPLLAIILFYLINMSDNSNNLLVKTLKTSFELSDFAVRSQEKYPDAPHGRKSCRGRISGPGPGYPASPLVKRQLPQRRQVPS